MNEEPTVWSIFWDDFKDWFSENFDKHLLKTLFLMFLCFFAGAFIF